MSKKASSTAKQYPKTLIVGIYTPYNLIEDPAHYYEEFKSLVRTLGVPYVHEMYIKLRSIEKGHFLTKGKLEEVQAYCQENNIEQVIFSELFTPMQERNVELFFDCEVMDREQLILEIFRKSAHSSEGKIQVEMAHMEFLKTRLAGKGKEYAQQEGRIGSRGPGETQKERLRRFFEDRLRQAKKRLETLSRSRDVQRKKRIESKTPLICLVGYTNAGKSTLLNTLTKSDVLAENKLFATLDTTTRELFLDDNKMLVSDTVGFISQLPTHLIEAFQSTLEELKYAHVLLHVIDVSNPAWKNHIQVVNETLTELKVTAPIVHVFNKIDLLSAKELKEVEKEFDRYLPHVIIQATSKAGINSLIKYIRSYAFHRQEK